MASPRENRINPGQKWVFPGERDPVMSVDATGKVTFHRGVAGVEGIQGPQGPQGIQGIQGPTGPVGSVEDSPIASSGLTAPRLLSDRFNDVVCFLDAPGAAADGEDTGSVFTGTDNTAALQAALDYCGDNRKRLYVPIGKYKFDRQGPAPSAVCIISKSYYDIEGYGAEFLIDNDETNPQSQTHFLKNDNFWRDVDPGDINKNKYDRELFRCHGLTFRGRWSHHPHYPGTTVLALMNFSKIELHQCRFLDIAAKGSVSRYNGHIRITDCTYERVASDAARFIDFDDYLVHGSTFRHCDDDCIAPPWQDPEVMPPGSVVVSDNIIEDCEGILISGATRNVQVTGNTLRRTHGTGITIGSLPVLNTTGCNIVCANNTIEDPLHRTTEFTFTATEGQTDFTLTDGLKYISGSDAFLRVQVNGLNAAYTEDGAEGTETNKFSLVSPASAGDVVLVQVFLASPTPSYALHISGAPRNNGGSGAVPGDYDSDTGAFLLPYGMGGSKPFYHTGVDPNAAQIKLPNMAGAVVTGNTIKRTLPSNVHYSDWGFGQIYSKWGWHDPIVRDRNFRQHGMVCVSDIEDVIIHNNQISGFPQGSGIYLMIGRNARSKDSFRRVSIKDNLIVNVFSGITHSFYTATDALTLDIEVVGNLIDVDPYHIQPLRTSPLDGSWQAGTVATRPAGIICRSSVGWTISDNTIRNAHTPIMTSSGMFSRANILRNILHCDPAAVGHSTSNKGIGDVPKAGEGFVHMIVDSDPTSGTYRELKNTCLLEADNTPTTGFYVIGHFVRNTSPSISSGKVLLGWVRLTTGTGHVANTDWAALYATNS